MGRWITKNGARIYLTNAEDELESAIADHYSKYSRLKTIILSEQEYGVFMHNVNTWYKKEYDKKRMISKAIGNYIYTFENGGYNEYRVIGRDLIESDIMQMLDEELKKNGK